MQALPRQQPRPISRFGQGEDGGITALAMILIGLLLLLLGVAIDASNAYRQHALLQITADSASHAGVTALARGEDPAEVRRAVEAMIERNLPEARFGKLLTNPATELQILHFDPESRSVDRLTPDTTANAVMVRLQRNEAAGNPLPMLVLGLFGQGDWSMAATSVAVLAPSRLCSNAEGIRAQGGLDLGAAPVLEAGFCLHSQTEIVLPASTHTTGPLRISLPDPATCQDACDIRNAFGPAGAELRPAALNLMMQNPAEHVARLAAGFLNPEVVLPEETHFFASRPLDGDPEALREVGLATEDLRAGSVVQMSPLQFSQLRERPSGLVYDVRCNTLPDDHRALWERSVTLLGDGVNATLRDLVLVTDCAIEMDDVARVEGALILMTSPGPALISALPGATLGDPELRCAPARRVRLMALGGLTLPRDLALSNLSVVAGGDIQLAADVNNWSAPHLGLVLDAGGQVTAEGSHSFARCPDEAAADPLMPAAQVITYAMPPLSGVLAPPIKAHPKTDMPGEKVKALSMKGSLQPKS